MIETEIQRPNLGVTFVVALITLAIAGIGIAAQSACMGAIGIGLFLLWIFARQGKEVPVAMRVKVMNDVVATQSVESPSQQSASSQCAVCSLWSRDGEPVIVAGTSMHACKTCRDAIRARESQAAVAKLYGDQQ